MPHFDADWNAEMLQMRHRFRDLFGRIFSQRRPITEIYACVTGKMKGPEGIPKSGWSPFRNYRGIIGNYREL